MNRARKKSKPKPLRSGKKEPGWQATPRQIRLALLIGGVVIVMMIGTIVVFSLPHRLTQQERILIEHYESVRTTLSRDDLPAARAAALLLADFSHDDRKIMAGAMAMARASSLSAARDAFRAISSRVIKFASGNRGYYRFSCSMAACPEACEPCAAIKYGDWIQTSPLVQNPFTGKAHPNCGVVK